MNEELYRIQKLLEDSHKFETSVRQTSFYIRKLDAKLTQSNYLKEIQMIRKKNTFKEVPDDINFSIEIDITFPDLILENDFNEWYQIRTLNNSKIKFCSPILSGESGITSIINFLIKCKAFGGEVDPSDGLEVNIYYEGFASFQTTNNYLVYIDKLKVLCTNFLRFEGVIDLFMNSLRVTSDKCISNRKLFSEDYHEMMYQINKSRTEDELADAFCMNNENFKLTLKDISSKGAIRFRQHEATLKVDDVEAWLRFLLWFIYGSLFTSFYYQNNYMLSIRDRYNQLFNLINERQIYQHFLNKLKMK